MSLSFVGRTHRPGLGPHHLMRMRRQDEGVVQTQNHLGRNDREHLKWDTIFE